MNNRTMKTIWNERLTVMRYYIPKLERLERCNSKTITFPWNFSECNGGSYHGGWVTCNETSLDRHLYGCVRWLWNLERRSVSLRQSFSLRNDQCFRSYRWRKLHIRRCFRRNRVRCSALPFDHIRLLRSLLYTMNWRCSEERTTIGLDKR